MHKQKRLFCGLSPPLMHRLNITAMCLFSHYHTMLGTVNSSKKRKLPECELQVVVILFNILNIIRCCLIYKVVEPV